MFPNIETVTSHAIREHEYQRNIKRMLELRQDKVIRSHLASLGKGKSRVKCVLRGSNWIKIVDNRNKYESRFKIRLQAWAQGENFERKRKWHGFGFYWKKI